MRLIVGYLLTALVFFAIDLLWLGLVARDVYSRFLGHLLAEDVNWAAATVFYLLFIVGIFIFAIMPGLARDSAVHTLVLGALFGFFTYATYDLTNLATLKDWPLGVVFVDVAWGVALTGGVALAGYHIMRWLR